MSDHHRRQQARVGGPRVGAGRLASDASDRDDLTCTCGHREAAHGADGRCTGTVSRWPGWAYCQCRQFKEQP